MRSMARRLPWLRSILVAAVILSLPACLLIGIPTDIPGLAYEDSPFGISIAGFLSNQDYTTSLEYMKQAGASTVRFMSKPTWGSLSWEHVESEEGTFDWSDPDEHYLIAKENGLDIMVNIYPDTPPWDSDSEYTLDYPNDMNAYLDFIAKAAERYDGDGKDDAPDSPVVNAWIIGVELERGEKKKWWGGTPDEYADLFVRTCEVIKSVNSNATVFSYGCNIFLNIRRGDIDTFTKPVLQEISELVRDKAFSFVYSIHYYQTDDIDEYVNVMSYIRQMLDDYGFVNTPIVMTDMAPFFHKDDPSREQKVSEHIIKTHVVGLAHGLKKIVWAQLSDGFGYGQNGEFFEAGLISNTNMAPPDMQHFKNLGFYTYKLMVEKLEGSDWDNIEPLMEGTNNTYVYRFPRKDSGESVYVAWWDYFNEPGYTPGDTKTFTLAGVAGTEVIVTSVVPSADTGQDVTDYATAFPVTVYPVSDGSIIIPLGEDPVLVEVE